MDSHREPGERDRRRRVTKASATSAGFLDGQRYGMFALALALLASLCVFPRASASADDAPTTTVYVVRHAEAAPKTKTKTKTNADPPLTEIGMARAADLAELLRGVALTAVYSTSYQRTRMTAGPAAGAAGVSTTRYRPGAIGREGGLPSAERLLELHPGASVLIVGHSNTAPQIVNALSGSALPDFAHDEHDNLVVVELSAAGARVKRHRYGALQAIRSGDVGGSTELLSERERRSVSGIVGLGSRLFVCPDEGTRLQEWRIDGDAYVAGPVFSVPPTATT